MPRSLCGVVLLALLALSSCARTSYLITVQDAGTREPLRGAVVDYGTMAKFPALPWPGRVTLSEEGTGTVRIRKGAGGYVTITDSDGIMHRHYFRPNTAAGWSSLHSYLPNPPGAPFQRGPTRFLVRIQAMPVEDSEEVEAGE